jgi:hypothetical protein
MLERILRTHVVDGDKRRNNPRFSQFNCIDENLRLRRKERKVKVIVQRGHLY